MFTIIALASFGLCLAFVVLNAILVLKEKAPIISLAGFALTFLVFAASGAVAAGLNVPILSSLNLDDEKPPDPNRFILQEEQLSNDRIGTIDTGNLKLLHGDLLSIANNGEGSVEVKAKIKKKKKGMTIQQNFLNVEDLIKLHGFQICKEIRYYAVMALKDGGETRVMSFNMDKSLITAVSSDEIDAAGLQEAVDSLWTSPSVAE